MTYMQRQMKAPVLQINETRGNPVEAFHWQTTPIGRVIQLRLPFGGITWHRPVAVEIRQEDTMQRLSIHDPTMRLLSVIVSIGLAVALVTFSIQRILVNRRKTS